VSVCEHVTWNAPDDIYKDGYRISVLDNAGEAVHGAWVPFNPYRDMPKDFEPREAWALSVMAEYWQKRAELAELYSPSGEE
jgi:hypothetical protein